VHCSFTDEVRPLVVVVVTIIGIIISIVRVLGTREAGCGKSNGEVGEEVAECGLSRDGAIMGLKGE
jgi:hypothetical protein